MRNQASVSDERRELRFLRTANNMIGFYGLSPQSVFNFDPARFSCRACGLFERLAKEFSGSSLAEIAELSLNGLSTKYRQTTIEQINNGRPVWLLWKGGHTDSHEVLAHMATSVVVGAMYDILATRKLIALAGAETVQTIRFDLLPDMARFVETHRPSMGFVH